MYVCMYAYTGMRMRGRRAARSGHIGYSVTTDTLTHTQAPVPLLPLHYYCMTTTVLLRDFRIRTSLAAAHGPDTACEA